MTEDGKVTAMDDDDLKNIEFEYVSLEEKENVLAPGRVSVSKIVNLLL